MSTGAVARPARPQLRDRVSCAAAWALVACCAVIGVTVVVAGERETSVATLQSAIDDHEVTEITVEGELQNGVVHWQRGPLRLGTDLHGAPPLRLGDDVQVTRVDYPPSRGEIGPWWVPGGAGELAFLLWVSILCLLVAGPQPWRATRWAWFWLLLAVPWVSVPGILLFGGSTGLLPPRDPQARLKGRRAFLLAVVLGGATYVLSGLMFG